MPRETKPLSNPHIVVVSLLVAGLAACAGGPMQRGDISFNPVVANPAFSIGEGPVVAVDEAHSNYHRIGARYQAFADLLRQDGYVVRASTEPFGNDTLRDVDILVISNALAEVNIDNWSLPTPSAFSETEVSAVSTWVEEGGALMLIADHMPFPGAVENIAAAFGVHFSNGLAVDHPELGVSEDEIEEHLGELTFRRSAGSLADHPITNGVRAAGTPVDFVTSYTGSAFQVDEDQKAQPLLIFSPSAKSLEPSAAWEFTSETNIRDVGEWFQGAVLEVGQGRIAVFGEAAMFTAQLSSNGTSMGMNTAGAEQNDEFLLNLVHWLSFLDAPRHK